MKWKYKFNLTHHYDITKTVFKSRYTKTEDLNRSRMDKRQNSILQWLSSLLLTTVDAFHSSDNRNGLSVKKECVEKNYLRQKRSKKILKRFYLVEKNRQTLFFPHATKISSKCR